jgi:glycerol kinase
MGSTVEPPLFLAIDQGGHSSRALVFDVYGRLIDHAFKKVTDHRPKEGWVEQDPNEIVGSTETAVSAVLSKIGAEARRVYAAGLATQRSSLLAWDRETGEALSPILSWQDRRADKWLQSFDKYSNEIQHRTGLRLSAHYGVSKMRWCLDHLPAVQAAHSAKRLVLGPLASYLIDRLVSPAPHCVDPSNASRTLLWNVERHDWDTYLLAVFGIPHDILPVVVSTRHYYGDLTGTKQPLPLTIVNGDQSAALYAYGAPRPDTIYINIGTGAFVQCLRQPGETTPQGFLTSVVYQEKGEVTTVIEGTVNGAGAALAWARNELGLTEEPADLSELLSSNSTSVVFLNGIGGLAAPHWRVDFRSRFDGEGDARDRYLAVAESIVFLLHDLIKPLAHAHPDRNRLLITGGLAIDALVQRLADLSGMAAIQPSAHEATAMGTAYLTAGCPETWPGQPTGVVFQPKENPELARRYRKWRQALDHALA